MAFTKVIARLFGKEDPESASNPKSVWYMNTQPWENADTMADAPPWLVFPNNPEPVAVVVNASQGNNEVYFDLWWGFWNALSPEARRSYLQEHHAPPVWEEYLKPGGEHDHVQQIIENLPRS